MEQISGRSPALRESVTELFIGRKVDHENRPQISTYVARVGNSVFLQNETIINNLPIFSTTTYAGSDVTTSKPQGPVSIEKGKVTNKCNGTVTIKNNFEVKMGAELEIKN